MMIMKAVGLLLKVFRIIISQMKKIHLNSVKQINLKPLLIKKTKAFLIIHKILRKLKVNSNKQTKLKHTLKKKRDIL